MREKKTRKMKKDSTTARLRETRRLQRIEWLSSRTTNVTMPLPSQQPIVDKEAQKRVLLQLAWKTLILTQKHKLIQEKISELQKETSEFVTSIMSNPENQRRYEEHLRLYSTAEPNSSQYGQAFVPLILVPETKI